jgi:hypothetical protein
MNRRQKKKATAKWHVKNRDRLLILSREGQQRRVYSDRDIWLLGNQVHNQRRWWKREWMWMTRRVRMASEKKMMTVKVTFPNGYP